VTKVLIIYHTFTGNTERMARAVAEGAKEVEDTEVILKKAAQAALEDFASADAVAFGSPNTFGDMTGALSDFFDRAWSIHEQVAGKPAVAFTSENPGQTGALKDIERFFNYYRLKKISDGVISARAPGDAEIKACKNLGRRLAEVARK